MQYQRDPQWLPHRQIALSSSLRVRRRPGPWPPGIRHLLAISRCAAAVRLGRGLPKVHALGGDPAGAVGGEQVGSSRGHSVTSDVRSVWFMGRQAGFGDAPEIPRRWSSPCRSLLTGHRKETTPSDHSSGASTNPHQRLARPSRIEEHRVSFWRRFVDENRSPGSA